MVSWFDRRRALSPLPRALPRLKPRGEQGARVDRVELTDLTPALMPYLGQVAYLQLVVFESLSRLVSAANDLNEKAKLSGSAGAALARHQGFVAEIRRRGDDPASIMGPFTASVDAFEKLTRGRDWFERLLSIYLTIGLLNDFFGRLSGGLPDDFGPRAAELLEQDNSPDVIVEILQRAIAADPRLASRLAMWGRRLVGDTLLVARSALHVTGNEESDESRIEPVFTELIAAHTRRMDALGLTA